MIALSAVLFVLLAAFSIWCRYRNRFLYHFAKPLPLVLLIIILLFNRSPGVIYLLVFAGLAAGIAGDMFLLRERTFRVGAIFFFLGHLLYIGAFVTLGGWPPLGILLVVLGYTVVYAAHLFARMQAKGGVGTVWLGLPYLVMVSLLLVFAAATAGQTSITGRSEIFPFLPDSILEMLFLSGAMLFYVSDLVLVWNRYAGQFGAAQLIILGSYYPAQALITAGALAHSF